ncbi:MAG: FAD-binding domain-containing protein [Streptosporangiaceae bacterium]
MPPGDLKPASGGHYRVFTPYWRAWRAATWRRGCPVPQAIQMPAVERVGRIPNRVMNPLRQAQRFDHDGQYVRRYVPELVGLDPADIQAPWKLAPIPGYPGPIVELS